MNKLIKVRIKDTRPGVVSVTVSFELIQLPYLSSIDFVSLSHIPHVFVTCQVITRVRHAGWFSVVNHTNSSIEIASHQGSVVWIYPYPPRKAIPHKK